MVIVTAAALVSTSHSGMLLRAARPRRGVCLIGLDEAHSYDPVSMAGYAPQLLRITDVLIDLDVAALAWRRGNAGAACRPLGDAAANASRTA